MCLYLYMYSVCFRGVDDMFPLPRGTHNSLLVSSFYPLIYIGVDVTFLLVSPPSSSSSSSTSRGHAPVSIKVVQCDVDSLARADCDVPGTVGGAQLLQPCFVTSEVAGGARGQERGSLPTSRGRESLLCKVKQILLVR